MITCKINVTKIDKARLFKGEKGIYLEIVLIETENDRFGNDYMVVQQVSKEDRAAGVNGNILGNAKIFQKPAAKTAPRRAAQAKQPTEPYPPPDDDGDDVPF